MPRLPLLLSLAFALPLAAAVAAEIDVSPAQPEIPARRFDLQAYGAVPDGHTDNTAAFHRAVAAVDAAGGGILVVPPGTYFTGPFDLCSRIDLRLEAGATIQFSPVFALYREHAGKGFRPMLAIEDAHDVRISGSGTINGNGSAWWPEALRFKKEANARHASSNTNPRPRMVEFNRCQRIRVDGITLTNSAVMNLVQNRCSDVTVEGISIFNPWNSPNTDGIDPKDCQRVLIARCRVDTGDDCIALGGSSGMLESNVLVTDCTFLHGHGCSIGSGTRSGVRRVIVRRCTFDGTETGVRLKSARGRGGLVDGVIYEDLRMRGVGTAISISCNYENLSSDAAGPMPARPVTDTTPIWRNVTIRNVTATDCRKMAGLISGLPEMPAENILLDHVTIDAPKGLFIQYARNVRLVDVDITTAKGPAVIAAPSAEVTSSN